MGTGGIEQNGPYVASGKHNFVLQATTEAIARELGNALVAPVVQWVPEGQIDPPSGHMRYHATISVSQETFEALLTDRWGGPLLDQAPAAMTILSAAICCSKAKRPPLIELKRPLSALAYP